MSMFRSVVLQVESRGDLLKAKELNLVLAANGQDFEMIAIMPTFSSELMEKTHDGGGQV